MVIYAVSLLNVRDHLRIKSVVLEGTRIPKRELGHLGIASVASRVLLRFTVGEERVGCQSWESASLLLFQQ